MSTKTVIITGVTVSMLLILFVKIYYDSTDTGGALLERNTAADRINAVNKGFLVQRNNLSRILNRKQQRLGQMECEVFTTTYFIHFHLKVNDFRLTQ
jgi:hypothetical protein